jgi:TPR repeat protein
MSEEHLNALPVGFEFEGYRIERILGAGGFGITYLGIETVIDRKVAIKEYMPVSIAGRQPGNNTVVPVSDSDRDDFTWGLDRFQKEAATLVAFRHNNIVSVLRFFNANGTSYLVMEYEQGQSLEYILAREETLDEEKVFEILMPLLDGLSQVHEKGFLHRDIKPDNIYIRDDGSPVLIDFGAARSAFSSKSAGLTAIITEGYAPVEQYETDSNQGPWTDIYALGASIYKCVTGERPMEAPKRTAAIARGQPDPMTPVQALVPPNAYSEHLLASINFALRVIETDRPQSVDAWRAALAGGPIPRARHGGSPSGDAAKRDDAAHYPSPSVEEGGTIVAGRPDAAPKPVQKTGIKKWAIAASVLVLLGAGGGAYLAFSGNSDGSGTGTNGNVGTAKNGNVGTGGNTGENGTDPVKPTTAVLEKAVTDARAAFENAATPEDRNATYEKFIAAETVLARHLFTKHSEEAKAATKRASKMFTEDKQTEAVPVAREAARLGDPNAMNLLGVAYEEGKGVEKDNALSAYWFRRAAELGDEYAQSNLAYNYFRGKGVDKDMALAYKWAFTAAEKNHPDAQYLLGILHENGQGTEKDAKKALEWYIKAADGGDADGAYRTCIVYFKGSIVRKNMAKAKAYCAKAAKKGHKKAKELTASFPRDEEERPRK